MTDLFLSVDVEADGPIPGANSMLSLGAVAIDLEGKIWGEFTCNLVTLRCATPDKDTMAFWAKNQVAWNTHRENLQSPEGAMLRYLSFLQGLPGRPVFMGYPAAYDFMFHHWYLMKFTGEDPCGFQALDLKSYAAAKLGLPYRKSVKANYPKHWFHGVVHDHTALTDARGQAILGVNMLTEET